MSQSDLQIHYHIYPSHIESHDRDLIDKNRYQSQALRRAQDLKTAQIVGYISTDLNPLYLKHKRLKSRLQNPFRAQQVRHYF